MKKLILIFFVFSLLAVPVCFVRATFMPILLIVVNPETLTFTLDSLKSGSSDFTVSMDTSFYDSYEGESKIYELGRMKVCEGYDIYENCINYALDLCPYISISPKSGESENTEIGFPLNASELQTHATGELTYSYDQIDDWTLSLVSPCFEGECPMMYDKNINGNPLPQNMKGQTFKCNITTDSNYMRVEAVFTGEGGVTEPVTIQEKAAALAKEVIGADYLGDGQTFGGKGWDIKKQSYVDVAQVFSGYSFWNNKERKTLFGDGLDCSGLIEWAYNYSFDPVKSLINNVIRVEGADGQYRKNSTPISEGELKTGDLLFLDKNNDNHIDHVAMYVSDFVHSGESYDVVEAFSVTRGVTVANFSDYKMRPGFTNILNYDSNPIRRVALSPSIAGKIKVSSPVDISVTTPDGITINPDTTIQTDEEYLHEVPGELYYIERDMGDDSRPRDTVYWFENKVGDYRIQVIPESNTIPTDTYSLEFTLGDQTTKLAENVPLSGVPVAGYKVEVNQAGEIESYDVVNIEYLLEKVREHIRSFNTSNSLKKPLLAIVDTIEKRIEINNKLQEKLNEQIEKLKEKPKTERAIKVIEKQLQSLKANEEAILKELSNAEQQFAKKANQKVSKKETTEFLKLLTKVLLTFH